MALKKIQNNVLEDGQKLDNLPTIASAPQGTGTLYLDDKGNYTIPSGEDLLTYYQEAPSGGINGVNTIFTLANTPNDDSLVLTRNGAALQLTDDYIISGNVITMSIAPESGDKLVAFYETGFVIVVSNGDMTKAVYDPQTIEADAFDVDNHTDGVTNKVYTTIEQTKLAGIEDGAEVNTINAGDNVSLLVNDANYLAVGDDVSDLNNDAGYLTNNRAIRAVSANTTALQTDFTILVDATAGDVTITLPAAQTGLVLNCKKTDISSNAMIIDADGAETIDGELTQQTITQNATLTVQSDGSNWHII